MRLATEKQIASRVSIHDRPCKNFLTCSLITIQKLVVVSIFLFLFPNTVRAHVGVQKCWGTPGTRPLWTGAWLTS